MEYIFLVLALVAVWHFVYEGIIAPGLRESARFELLALRDELRRIRIERGILLDDEAFDVLNEGFNSQLGRLSDMTFTAMLRMRDMAVDDPEVKAEIDHRLELLASSPISEVRELHAKLGRQFFKVVLINSGGWFPYVSIVLLPMLVAFVLAHRLYASAQDAVRSVVIPLSTFPERCLPRYQWHSYKEAIVT